MQWLLLRDQVRLPAHTKGKHAERQTVNKQCQTCTLTKPWRCAWNLPGRTLDMPYKRAMPCLGRAW